MKNLKIRNAMNTIYLWTIGRLPLMNRGGIVNTLKGILRIIDVSGALNPKRFILSFDRIS